MTDPLKLLALQDLDLKIARLKKELDSLPERGEILAVRAQKDEIQKKASQASALKAELDRQVRDFEDETTRLKESIAREQQKLDEGADHRMVSSITKEMEGFTRRINKIEFDEIALMEKIESIVQAQNQIAAMLEAATVREDSLIEKYKKAGTQLTDQISDSMTDRAHAAAEIDPADLERYEELLKTKKGIAVTRLKGSTCSACAVSLTGAQLDSLMRGPSVNICPSCHRIIVVEKKQS